MSACTRPPVMPTIESGRRSVKRSLALAALLFVGATAVDGSSIEYVDALEASRAYEATVTMMEVTKQMLNASLRLIA